jgi:hypothetical protein
MADLDRLLRERLKPFKTFKQFKSGRASEIFLSDLRSAAANGEARFAGTLL